MKDKRPFDLAMVDEIESIIGKHIIDYANENGMTWRKAVKQLARKHKIQLRLAPWYKEEKGLKVEKPNDTFAELLRKKGIKFGQTA